MTYSCPTLLSLYVITSTTSLLALDGPLGYITSTDSFTSSHINSWHLEGCPSKVDVAAQLPQVGVPGSPGILRS